jgi:predicted nucleotidyltransferase
MDKIPVEIRQVIEKYISELEKNKVHIHKAVLFGSYAVG